MIGVFGDLIFDIAVRAHGPLQIGSDVTGEISYQGGGSAGNVATWLGHLGSSVRFAGALGKDLAGETLKMELASYGVESFLAEKDDPTGTILLFLDDRGERTMVTSRGANLLVTPSDIPDTFFAGLSHLHLTGYSFFGSKELATTTMDLLDRTKERNIPFSVDPSSYALLAEFGPDRFLRLIEGACLILPNLDEGKVLTGEREPDAIIGKLSDIFPCVAMTLGSEGCLVAKGDRVRHLPANFVQALDTTGAGDAFAAGFLHAFVQGRSPWESAQLGNETAGKCVLHYGGRPIA